MTAHDFDFYRLWSRVAIVGGVVAMCIDHWFGPFGEDAGLLFLTGLFHVAIGVYCIPERPTNP